MNADGCRRSGLLAGLLLLGAGGELAALGPPATVTPAVAPPESGCAVLLETLRVPAISPRWTTSHVVLEAGREYTLEVSGTFSYWGGHRGGGADALFNYFTGRKDRPLPCLLVNGEGLNRLLAAAGETPVYREDHTYRVGIVGTGAPLRVRIHDPKGHGDNSGHLTVRLCATAPRPSAPREAPVPPAPAVRTAPPLPAPAPRPSPRGDGPPPEEGAPVGDQLETAVPSAAPAPVPAESQTVPPPVPDSQVAPSPPPAPPDPGTAAPLRPRLEAPARRDPPRPGQSTERLCPVLLETLRVPAISPRWTTSHVVLEAGREYTLEVSGTFSYWSGHRGGGADALFNYFTGRKDRPLPCLLVNGEGLNRLLAAAGETPVYREDHTYRVGIVGTGARLRVRIHDPKGHGDNSGHLTVRLCAAEAPR